MEISKTINKDKIALVAVGYNRLDSMKRLLDSLQSARYEKNDIPLVISIDASGDTALYDFVRNFGWKHGEKYVNIQDNRLGLKNHILQCGDLTEYFRAVVILEDDIFVSEYFYNYVESAVDYYEKDARVGGISLYQNEHVSNKPIYFQKDGSDTYLKQTPASWGECWTKKQWELFREWYKDFSDDKFEHIDMPDYIKSWKRAWSKYYMAYLIETNRYFVFPHDSHTTCFGDAGEHSAIASTYGQANLLCGKKKYFFKPFEEMVRYNIYMVNESVYEWAGYTKDQLCVDWYGNNHNFNHCRYILTPYQLPFKVVKSYGLSMRPIELNIKYNIKGSNLYVYDSADGNANAIGKPETLATMNYHIRTLDFKMGARYVYRQLVSILKNKIFRK